MYKSLQVIIIQIFYVILMVGENGNTTDSITKDKILNQPLLEEGTFLSYASKVIMCNMS